MFGAVVFVTFFDNWAWNDLQKTYERCQKRFPALFASHLVSPIEDTESVLSELFAYIFKIFEFRIATCTMITRIMQSSIVIFKHLNS